MFVNDTNIYCESTNLKELESNRNKKLKVLINVNRKIS